MENSHISVFSCFASLPLNEASGVRKLFFAASPETVLRVPCFASLPLNEASGVRKLFFAASPETILRAESGREFRSAKIIFRSLSGNYFAGRIGTRIPECENYFSQPLRKLFCGQNRDANSGVRKLFFAAFSETVLRAESGREFRSAKIIFRSFFGNCFAGESGREFRSAKIIFRSFFGNCFAGESGREFRSAKIIFRSFFGNCFAGESGR
ncbi:Uncharacterized protein dnm_045280 [Desulfonema magnum]|uniref:Uncharacterized protein n=1 Tax=Desulfonema magnum TaxID=45655 RepID=A0A975GP57_9BACT|nr:Uncharacterized protein dnm_045280 [Desulfonema magnum]